MDQLRLPFRGNKLQEARERAGVTRPGLARRCAALGRSVTPQHIRRLENGETPAPRPPLLVTLANALELTVDAFLDDAPAATAETAVAS